MYDFSTLPPHILTNILTNLDITDFRHAVQTCKSWYYASCHPRIIKQIRVYIPSNATSIEFLSRPIDHIDLNNPNMNQFKYRELFENFGHSITELEILAPLTPAQFYEIFMYLPVIRKFYFYDKSITVFISTNQNDTFRIAAIKNLANIRFLSIHMSTNNFHLYQILLAGCTNLDTFVWYGSDALQIDHSAFLRSIVRESRDHAQIMCSVTELAINDIDKQKNSIFFQCFNKLKLPNLKSVKLAEISDTYYDTMFKDFCQSYNYLECLSMSSCNDKQLHDICAYITKLKSLDLEHCNVSNSIQEINKLRNLEHLSMRHKNLIGMNTDLIALINKQMHHLNSLTLTKISSDLLHAICSNCRRLESLSLFAIDTKECEPIFRQMTQLKTLHLAFSDPPKCHSSQIISSSIWNIMRLTKLESLWINQYVPGITPDLIKQFPNLNQSFMASIFDPDDEELARIDACMRRAQNENVQPTEYS